MRKTNFLTNTSLAGNAAGIVPTDAERRAGRFMRAPDHDAGTGGGDGNAGSGGGDAGAGAGDSGGGAAGAAGAGAGAEGGAGDGGAAGDAQDGGAADGKPGSGGGAGGDGGSILSDAGREGDGGDGGAGDGPRLTFGEGEASAEILGAPEAYELSVPKELADQGVTFDKEAFDLVEPIFRDLNLSGAAAQSIVNGYAEKILPLFAKRGAEAADTTGAEMRRGWETAANEEFNGKDGNPTLKEAKALARQAFLASGIKSDSPFLSMLEESGLGNHPDMIRFVSWVGRNVGEAKVDQGGGGVPTQRLADKVYGQPVPRGDR